MLCDYGCGKEAKHQFKNGKWCCSKNWHLCVNKSKNMKGKKNHFYGKTHTKQTLQKLIKLKLKNNNPMFGKSMSMTIKTINKKYPTFSKVEEMRYNPDKPKGKEIQVHCKNHKCKNSKEQGGWFTPKNYEQIARRIYAIEKNDGNGGAYYYCSEECKIDCPLFNLRKDPKNKKVSLYTSTEYQIFRHNVLERENYLCEYCDKKATDVHHSRPQKLEPGFVLDPDFGVACCKDCHNKYGHKDECSTGKLTNINNC